MPVNGFIAAMNANNAFGEFIKGRAFVPRPLVATRSPALDVAVPSNYARLVSCYDEAPAGMRNMVYPASLTDAVTLKTMERVYKKYGVFLDPHGAVAFAAAEEIAPRLDQAGHFVILATGHPAREATAVKEATGQTIKVPYNLEQLHQRCDPIALIDPHLDALEGAIASCF
jgi:threonine synthase